MKEIVINKGKLKDDEITEVLDKARIVLRNDDGEFILSHFERVYFLPGGKVEVTETPVDAVKRELLEETNIHIMLDDISPFVLVKNYLRDYESSDGTIVNRLVNTYYFTGFTSKDDIEYFNLTRAEKRDDLRAFFVSMEDAKELLKEYQNFEVYLDSPLAIEATKIFTKNMRECFDEDALALVNAGINPLIFDGLKTATTSDDSKMINFIEKPKVIISASGMCDAGRIRHHLKHNLWREECTILFVGYQAMGTLGRRLIEGEKNVKLFGEPIEVKARIESLHGISGHADMNGLLKWLGAFKEAPQRVFVVHGEDTVTEEFAKTVEEKFGYQAYAPFPCSEADLLTNEILSEGVKIPVKAKKPAQRKADAAFERLVAAGKRLLDVIYKNEGLANKDKAKFESQINNLSDKWDI